MRACDNMCVQVAAVLFLNDGRRFALPSVQTTSCSQNRNYHGTAWCSGRTVERWGHEDSIKG